MDDIEMDAMYDNSIEELSSDSSNNSNTTKKAVAKEMKPLNDGKNILDYVFVDFDEIEILRVPGKGIKSLKGIDELGYLRILDISDNNLTSLKGIEGCKKLEELYCQGNKIKTVKWIKDLSLSKIDFSNNNVSSIIDSNLDRIDEVEGSGNPYINSNNTDSIGDEENVDLDVTDNVDDSVEESSTESGLEVIEEIFTLEDRHVNLINKYISKSNSFLDELGNENQMEIDVETKTLDRMIDAPILKK